jgi:hypothetical protein
MKQNYFHVIISFLLVAAFISSFGAKAQTITGTFPLLAGQRSGWKGFYGFDTYPIGSADVSEEGKFVLDYSGYRLWMGQLVSAGNRPFIVILVERILN